MKAELADIVDSALEGTIVASFTKIGFSVRQNLFGWNDSLPDMTGQTVIITGGTSGIGRATAKRLAEIGADIHLTSRSQERADTAAAELIDAGTGSVTGHGLDLGDFDSIRSFVADMATRPDGVDVLINNAGALTSDYEADDRGIELTLSTHLVGPYLLVTELRPQLNSGARVLFMSSGGMYSQGLDVSKIEMSEADYRGAIAYAKAKRGQVELVTYLAPRWAPEVTMHSMHPGWVDTPGVDAGLPGFGKVMGPLLRSAAQGADTMAWLAATGGEAPVGQFWLDREPRRTAYLPGTGTDTAERQRLVDWLDAKIRERAAGRET